MQAVFGNKNKTFRPKKNFQKGTKLYQLHKYAKVMMRSCSAPRSNTWKYLLQFSLWPRIRIALQATVKATLGAGNLQEAVLLPEGEDKNEWLAVNTVCVCLCCRHPITLTRVCARRCRCMWFCASHRPRWATPMYTHSVSRAHAPYVRSSALHQPMPP
jgi:hypothetical protein